MTGKEKAKFRASTEWKNYRTSIIAARGAQCQCCFRKMRPSALQLHHKDLDSANYTDLSDEKKHVLLCSNCHSVVHSLYTILNNKKNQYKNAEMFEFIRPYFIISDYLKELFQLKLNK